MQVESTTRNGYKIQFKQQDFSDPRPMLTDFIDQKSQQYRIYSDRPDKKQSAMIKMESDIKFLERLEDDLNKITLSWEILIMISRLINEMLSKSEECDGVHISVDFKENPKTERYSIFNLKLHEDA